MNFVRYLLEKSRDPEKLFILGDHGTLTYAEFVEKLENLSSVLFNRYGSRKKILLMADNTPFFIISYLSIIYSGNIAVLVETRISKTDLTEIINTSSLSGALVQNKYCHYFEDSPFDIMNETILRRVAIKNFFYILLLMCRMTILRSSSSHREAPVQKKASCSPIKILSPIPVQLLSISDLDETDRMCVVLPFFYCYGASLLHTHLRVGGSIVLNQKPFLGSIINDIDTYRVYRFCRCSQHLPDSYQ